MILLNQLLMNDYIFSCFALPLFPAFIMGNASCMPNFENGFKMVFITKNFINV